MSINKSDTGTRLVAYVFVLVVVHARPCFEGGGFEPCFLSRASLSEEVYPDIKEQFVREVQSVRQRHKYDVLRRDMRDIPEEFIKNCTACEEEAEDVVDREDHITQYLAEFLVNTDSEITSLEASDVEEIRENTGSGSKDDGYFAFLTGDEKVVEVEGAWSHPARTIVEESEFV